MLWLLSPACDARTWGLQLSEKALRRLMVEVQLVVSCNRRRRYNLYCGEIWPAPDNLIARDFKAEQPKHKCLTDTTEFLIPTGKVWLSPVVGFFDGKVMSWSLSTRPDAELVNTMLDNAVETLDAGEWPLVRSDRDGIIAGQSGWKEWMQQVLFAPCPVEGVHLIMPHEKAFWQTENWNALWA